MKVYVMAITINVPNIGTNELEVTEVLVKIGDKININQPLLIIEGEKASMEIPSPYSGTIHTLYVKIGDKVHTGSAILSLDIDNEHTDIKSMIHQKIPIVQNNINQSNLNTKNNTEHSQNIIKNDIKDNKNNKFYHNDNFTHATPLIRYISRKLGIDLAYIKGSGRKGRITKEDIYNYLSVNPNQNKNYDLTTNANKSFTDLSTNYQQFGDIHSTQLNKIQKISGIHLQKNWSTIPHVTQFDMIDITNLEIFRKQQNLEITKNNINYKITILVFIIKAVAKALEKLPRFNSSLSQDGNTLILKKYINIGIAVDTEKGLIVPVLRNVNKKGIITLSQELSEVAQKARSKNQLNPTDIQGGSFTISNLGGIGGTAFTPIINAPEVAILGISKSSIQPIWNGKKFTPKLMLPIALSYDHRVIDGADGAKFVTLINKIISDIRLLSM